MIVGIIGAVIGTDVAEIHTWSVMIGIIALGTGTLWSPTSQPGLP